MIAESVARTGSWVGGVYLLSALIYLATLGPHCTGDKTVPMIDTRNRSYFECEGTEREGNPSKALSLFLEAAAYHNGNFQRDRGCGKKANNLIGPLG